MTFAVCSRYQLEDIERVLLAPAEQRMTLAEYDEMVEWYRSHFEEQTCTDNALILNVHRDVFEPLVRLNRWSLESLLNGGSGFNGVQRLTYPIVELVLHLPGIDDSSISDGFEPAGSPIDGHMLEDLCSQSVNAGAVCLLAGLAARSKAYASDEGRRKLAMDLRRYINEQVERGSLDSSERPGA